MGGGVQGLVICWIIMAGLRPGGRRARRGGADTCKSGEGREGSPTLW